jgi:sugar/nucleoside kinase (ribokinase family)
MNPSPRFLGLDTVMMDVVVKIAALPKRGMDELATSQLVSAGGGFNAMSAAARQGMAVTYLGQIGNGAFAALARTALEDEGIEVPIVPLEDVDLGICLVLVDDDGERTFVTSPGAEGRLQLNELETVEVRAGDVLFMSGYDFVYRELCEQVLAWLRTVPAALVVAFDPGPRVLDIETAVLGEVLSRTDWLLCNEREARALTDGVELPAVAQQLLARTRGGGVVVRRGDLGCLAVTDADGRFEVPAFATDVVDTNGAGDVHNGVFLAEHARGTSVLEALQRANIAASVAIGVLGPATCPTRDVVSEKLATFT